MASLMVTRRRAEQFAAVVDAPTSPGEVPGDLRQLVDMVGAMRQLDVPPPRPEFAASLREQLMAEAETALAPASPLALPPRRGGARERRLTAAAAVFTLVGGTAGMAAAAQDALPGDALYPIKRGIEDAQLSVQSDADSRGRTYLEQAASRLEEADRLVQDDAPSSAVADTVDSFVVQSVAGADLLLASFSKERAPEDVEVLRTFAADALDGLQKLAETAPADIQPALARAAAVLQRIDQQANDTCDQCSTLPSLQMPVLMAQAAEISRAMEAVRQQQPNNDHPSIGVALPRPVPAEQPREQRGQHGGGDSGGQVPQAPAANGPTLGAEAPTAVLPKEPRKLFDGVDKATGGLLGETTKTSKDTVEDLGNQLKDGLESAVGGGE